MGTERRSCQSRNIGNGEGKEGVLFSIVVSCFILFCEVRNGGGGFLRITAGSDVSLGIDSWLDVIRLLLVALVGLYMDGGGICVDYYHLLYCHPTLL